MRAPAGRADDGAVVSAIAAVSPACASSSPGLACASAARAASSAMFSVTVAGLKSI
jgi:hypothetical protein